MKLGPYQFHSPVVLAPMAGVTDAPFRVLAVSLGADFAVSEMISANSALYSTAKTQRRLQHHRDEAQPRIVQIAGGDPVTMAEAARINVAAGADVIDINMGCPAKKVCNKLAGSALLSDPRLVYKILSAVTASVEVPVSLKIRTGPSADNRNGIAIARIAEDCGIQMLSVHGRTRADKFLGNAEYDTIARIKQNVSIPVLANGDIDTPDKAKFVLDYTGADGIMIGRAAQGNPWIFSAIKSNLNQSSAYTPPSNQERADVLCWHLRNLYQLYGEYSGVRVARKHIAWYCKGDSGAASFRKEMYTLEHTDEQLECVLRYFRASDTGTENFRMSA